MLCTTFFGTVVFYMCKINKKKKKIAKKKIFIIFKRISQKNIFELIQTIAKIIQSKKYVFDLNF
jgi:hypothetical protein